MKMSKHIDWPSKPVLGIVLLNFVLQLACIPFFPLAAPCHWTVEGIANGYMNRYLYILYYLLPFLVLWIFARTPQNRLVAFFYNLPQGRIIRAVILILTTLATWIPAYAILFVPKVIPVDQQTTWITGMVCTVQGTVDISALLIALTCAIVCIKPGLHRGKG